MHGISGSSAAIMVALCLFVAVLLGRRLRYVLPESHLDAETRETVKLAMGLLATMSALLLSLLVSSAKSDYDRAQAAVSQLVAKAVLTDRLLELYGPETAQARTEFRGVVEALAEQIWDEGTDYPAGKGSIRGQGDAIFRTIQTLSPRDDNQKAMKSQVLSVLVGMAEIRAQLLTQTVTSISLPLLIVVAAWLVMIFGSFSMLAPPNATAAFVLVIAAMSVGAAVFLILELDQPFSGSIQIPRAPVLALVSQLAQ